MTEDEMIGWYHLLNGHEFKQTPGDGEGWMVKAEVKPIMLQLMKSQRVGHDLATEQHYFSNSFPIFVIEQSPLCYHFKYIGK